MRVSFRVGCVLALRHNHWRPRGLNYCKRKRVPADDVPLIIKNVLVCYRMHNGSPRKDHR